MPISVTGILVRKALNSLPKALSGWYFRVSSGARAISWPRHKFVFQQSAKQIQRFNIFSELYFLMDTFLLTLAKKAFADLGGNFYYQPHAAE